ncbi:alpha/beta fold hydrolase [Streptomyces coryli]
MTAQPDRAESTALTPAPFDVVAEADGAHGARIRLRGPAADDRTAPMVLVSPAMGTPARFYAPLAAELSRSGLVPLLFDQRGQGERADGAGRFGYAELLADLDAAVTAARTAFPDAPLAVLGHSLGGQLALLQAAQGAHRGTAAPDAVAVVAAGSVWYRSFGAVRGLGVLAGSQSAAALATVLGRWPGDLFGFGGRQPARVMRDWARQSRTGRYRLPEAAAGSAAVDYDALMARLDLPVLAVGVAGDRLAPPGAVRHLCGKVPKADLEKWSYTASKAGGSRLDHFRWVRHGEGLAAYVADWLGRTGRPVGESA